jgi:hypothetical protein
MAARSTEALVNVRIVALRAHTRSSLLGVDAHGDVHPIGVTGVDASVVGFLKLLGPGTTVETSDLRIMLDDSLEVGRSSSIRDSDGEDNSRMTVEKIRLVMDRSQKDERDRWKLEGAARTNSQWFRISLLSYTIETATGVMSFADYADKDPRDRGSWPDVGKVAAKDVWDEYSRCREKCPLGLSVGRGQSYEVRSCQWDLEHPPPQ